MTERRPCWVVLVRVNERADWCAYGPMTHPEALAFRKISTGSGMERQIAQLIPAQGRSAALVGKYPLQS